VPILAINFLIVEKVGDKMEPNNRRNIDELAGPQDRQAGGELSSIRGISREIGEDLKRLTDQHVALLKKESAISAKKFGGSLILAGLAFFLVAFGLIRLIEALVGFVFFQLGWIAPNAEIFTRGIFLIIVAALMGVVGKNIIQSIQKEKSELMAEMREDWLWLKRILK